MSKLEVIKNQRLGLGLLIGAFTGVLVGGGKPLEALIFGVTLTVIGVIVEKLIIKLTR